MIVSKANSIRFQVIDDILPNFDNTILKIYYQRFADTDSVIIQVRSDVGEVPTMKVIKMSGAVGQSISGSKEATYSDFEIYEFLLSMSAITEDCFYLKIRSSTSNTIYKSEPICIVSDVSDLLLLEWYGNDNSFQMDYSTGITCKMRIDGILKNYIPEGDINTYSDQGNVIKLSETVTRALELMTEELPAYLSETITVALAHDMFYINEVQYVSRSKPVIEQADISNWYELSVILTAFIVIGRNSHDSGTTLAASMATDSEVSKANSIAFVRIDDKLPNFDNTLFKNRDFINHLMYQYCQYFLKTDIIKIQVKTKKAITPVVVADGNTETATWSNTSGSDFDIYEYTLNMSTYSDTFTIKITAGTDAWVSEPIQLVDARDDMLVLEWFNFDNAFDIDYSNDITNKIYIDGILKEYSPGGSITLYDNLGELTKLKEVVTRGLTLLTGNIPDYLAEKIRIALAHDKFFINEVEWISQDVPTIESDDMTNFKTLEISLNQRNVLGINTSDIGFECDSLTVDNVIVIEKVNQSGNISIPINANYLLHTITILYDSGSDVLVKAGSTPAGDDVICGVRPNAVSPDDNIVVTVHRDFQSISNLYVAITGTAAIVDIYIQLIINRSV